MTAHANPLSDLLAKKGVLLADGATGTSLFAMGLEAGEAPADINLLGEMVKNICFNNARDYFAIELN